MRLILLIFTILLSVGARAEGLSFDMAHKEMLDNNLEIEAGRKAIEIAQLELQATRGLRYPSIDLVADYTLMQRDIRVDLGGSKGALSNIAQNIINKGVTNGIISPDIAKFISEGLSPLLAADWGYTLQKRSTFIGAVTLTQPIYAGGRINAAITAAEIITNQAEYQLQAIINNTTTQLVEYYYGVVLAERDVEVRSDVVNGIKQHLDNAKAMEEEGLIPHSEVLYVEYRLAEAERELNDATNKLTIAREALSKILNRECNEILTDRIFIVDSIYPINYYIESATNINPILLGSRGNLALSEENIKLTRAALLPEIAALGGAIIASHNLTTILPRWSVGIGLKMNLFNGLTNERRHQAANRMSEAAFSITEFATNKITLLVENEYYSAINSLKAIDMINTSLRFARAYLEAKSEGFKEGFTPSQELIDAQLELQAAELKQLAVAYDFCKYLARLLEAAGISDTFTDYQQRAIFL